MADRHRRRRSSFSVSISDALYLFNLTADTRVKLHNGEPGGVVTTGVSAVEHSVFEQQEVIGWDGGNILSRRNLSVLSEGEEPSLRRGGA